MLFWSIPCRYRHRQPLHFKSWEIRVEGNAGEIFAGVFGDLGLRVLSHVISPNHFKFPPSITISTLHNKFSGKNIC
jgi:hypothetical protein